MNNEVHDDEPAGGGGVLAEGVPAVDEDGDVVVPVEEDQLLLPQHDEDGVPQLGHLGQHEHPRPEPAHSVVLDEAGDAEGVVEAVGVERVHELWQGPGGAHDAEHGQEHAPPRQGAAQVEGRPTAREIYYPLENKTIYQKKCAVGRYKYLHRSIQITRYVSAAHLCVM